MIGEPHLPHYRWTLDNCAAGSSIIIHQYLFLGMADWRIPVIYSLAFFRDDCCIQILIVCYWPEFKVLGSSNLEDFQDHATVWIRLWALHFIELNATALWTSCSFPCFSSLKFNALISRQNRSAQVCVKFSISPSISAFSWLNCVHSQT